MSVEPSKIKAIFLAALEKTTAAERSAYLDEACATDAALRDSVEAMLRAHDLPDRLLDQPAAGHLTEEDDPAALDFLEPSAKPGALGRLGHYEVLEVLGRGGMGVVLRAFDDKLHRVVAVKALAPALAGNALARKRFVREARAAAAVTHENVIAIYAVEDQGPVPYLVMQCVVGKTLQEKLEATGALELRTILRIGLQMAEGLAAAHRQGLIHRDIKPANILLENGVERVKITDFGLARAVDDASLTQSGYIAGTPQYMSPEQARGEALDHRSDLFSLGSVLYAMCSGHPPFRAENTMAVLKRVCEDEPRRLREANPDIPEWLEAIISRLHRKARADRFATAQEVAELLSRCLAQLQSGTALSTSLAGVGRPARTGSPRRRKLLRWGALVLALVVATGGMWWIAKNWNGGRDEAKNDPTTPPTPAHPAPPTGPVTLKPARPPLLRHTAGVRALAFSHDGKVLASGGPDRAIYLWDTTTWEARGPLQGHKGNVTGLAFAPNGRLASVTSEPDDYRVRIWDVENALPAKPLGTATTSGMWAVAYSPDGRTVACGGWDKKLYLLDAETGVERVDPPPEVTSHFIRGLSFSTDGRRVVTGGGPGPTKVWNAATGEEIPTTVNLPVWLCPTFLPAGGLACWNFGEGRVMLFDFPSGQLRAPAWRAHTGTINGLAVSKDGRHLASIGEDGLVRIWSTADQTKVAELVGHRGAVFSVAFSPDGTRLASGGEEDLSIYIWNLPEVCHVRKP
jgi:hypothetical protein